MMGGSTRKGYLFHASYERLEISPVEVFKRVESLSFGSVKRPRSANG